ncbi:FMN-linked oxidoreductase [Obba rivulosa]|uniref:FMN-linked oxidoreductase n=1 Tax=Obba rivulosa TaxID=1052685 RepID=A0A8E2AWX8_9APHY|nr:FMN-linked oxidoreductase [Obba rivulosa]
MEDIISPAAPNVPYFTPAQNPPVGAAIVPQPDGKPVPKLFQPLKIRGLEVHNRIFLSSLAQSSADDGKVTPWHFAHFGGIMIYGPGISMLEGTAVAPNGRTSPQDLGLWSDAQVAPLQKLVDFAHAQNQKVGVQLAHAGRKASTVAPWLSAEHGASAAVGGWPHDVYAPSAVAYNPENPAYPVPKALTTQGIRELVGAFAGAARRAVEAGVDAVEIHGAHGYLIHEFVSPVTNKRTDEYGGSFENRTRFAVEVVDAVRAVIPSDMPLFFRVSASDWLEEVAPDEPSWRIEDTIRLGEILAEHGVDLYDVSSGGLERRQKILFKAPTYQAHFSEAVKKQLGDKILVSAVGGITSGSVAQQVLEEGQADLIFVGRQFLRDHQTVWTFARDLEVEIRLPNQVEWVFRGRGSSRSKQ